MKYTYYGGGQIKTGSWGLYRELIPIIYKFARHSVAYIRHQAELGKLEPVQIDRVWIGNNSYTYRQPNVIYVDKLNSLFHETELCTLAEANALIDEAILMLQFKPKTVLPVKKNYHEEGLPTNLTYKNGQILYSRQSAHMGHLERVVIYRAISTDPELYEDYLKGLWMTEELVSEEEANVLVEEYFEKYPPINTNFEKSYHEESFPSTSKYQNGETLFAKKSAQLGELEKVVIYRALPNNPEIYEDNLKGLWSNDDLVNEHQAKALALAYWQKRKEQIKDELNKRI